MFPKVALPAEVRAADVRAAEVRAAEVRAAEVRATEVRATDVSATEVRAAKIVAFHRGEIEATDEELDVALGLPPRRPTGDGFEDEELSRRHPGESLADLPTPYAVLRGLFEALQATAEDRFFDLGCADGRVVLYGAVTTSAHFCGIELVEERAAGARAAAAALGLDRVEILAGNVLDHDLSQASVFFLSRPFGEATEPKVFARLHDEGRRRPLTVVTHRVVPGRVDASIFEPVATGTLSIHRGRWRPEA